MPALALKVNVPFAATLVLPNDLSFPGTEPPNIVTVASPRPPPPWVTRPTRFAPAPALRAVRVTRPLSITAGEVTAPSKLTLPTRGVYG